MKYVFKFIIIGLFLYTHLNAAASASGSFRIPAGEYAYCTIDFTRDTIIPSPPRSIKKVTVKAKQAIAFAPRWVSISLEDRFSTLAPTLQDTLARIILTTDDPYVDEIAFTIAHMPEEVLTHNSFHFQLLRENVLGVYRADTGLEYVTIIDSGSAEAGGDYFSTVRYTVLEEGVETVYTLPRDIYYWYIVHPKLQGELPSYITPNSPGPSAPPAGKFWRSYLWSYSEPAYTALRDTMKGISFLWANKINSPEENGALGRLSQWCNRILPWGNHPQYRWPQPVYLYHQHCGTCSEHAWFANAAARTVLIPATVTKAARFDHKWNEFFYRRWIDWEPINGWIDRIDEPNHANDYWSDKSKPPLNGCFNWRGDGFIWGTTEHYTPVCTLAVTVTDGMKKPVDGARVTIDAEGVPGNFLMAGWTGSDGRCRFLLGDDISYFTAAVKSSLGSVNAEKVIRNAEGGKRYEWLPTVSKSGTELKIENSNTLQNSNESSVEITCHLDATHEIVYGRHEYALFGHSFPCSFSDERSTGEVDFFVCDSANFTKYTSGGSFNTLYYKNGMTDIDTVFTLPKSGGQCYCVVSGEKKETVTGLVHYSVSMHTGSGNGIHGSTGPVLDRMSISCAVNKNSVQVTFTLSKAARSRVVLYTVSGAVAGILFDGVVSKGTAIHSYSLDMVPAGVYYCRVQSAMESQRKRVVVVK